MQTGTELCSWLHWAFVSNTLVLLWMPALGPLEHAFPAGKESQEPWEFVPPPPSAALDL